MMEIGMMYSDRLHRLVVGEDNTTSSHSNFLLFLREYSRSYPFTEIRLKYLSKNHLEEYRNSVSPNFRFMVEVCTPFRWEVVLDTLAPLLERGMVLGIVIPLHGDPKKYLPDLTKVSSPSVPIFLDFREERWWKEVKGLVLPFEWQPSFSMIETKVMYKSEAPCIRWNDWISRWERLARSRRYFYFRFTGALGMGYGSYDDYGELEKVVKSIFSLQFHGSTPHYYLLFANNQSTMNQPLPEARPVFPVPTFPGKSSEISGVHDARATRTIWETLNQIPYALDREGKIKVAF